MLIKHKAITVNTQTFTSIFTICTGINTNMTYGKVKNFIHNSLASCSYTGPILGFNKLGRRSETSAYGSNVRLIKIIGKIIKTYTTSRNEFNCSKRSVKSL